MPMEPFREGRPQTESLPRMKLAEVPSRAARVNADGVSCSEWQMAWLVEHRLALGHKRSALSH